MQFGNRRFYDTPNAHLIDGRVTVDENVAEADDLTQVRNASREIGRQFQKLVQRFANDLEFAFNSR
jgi:hypothetical protein